MLSFVVCGGGPTGVEAAAEIYDLCQEDIMKYYPKVCRQEVSIHVIQSGEHILNTVSQIIEFSHSFTTRILVPVLRSNLEVCRGRLCPQYFLIGINVLQDKFARDGVDLITGARLVLTHYLNTCLDRLTRTQCLICAPGLRCVRQEG